MVVQLFMLLGAWLYRWRGLAHPKKKYFPRPFNQMVFALPYALFTFFFWYHIIGFNYALAIGIAVWGLTTLGALTGHGGGHDLGSDKDERDDERLEFLIKWLKPKIPEYWYDVLLLSITGLAVTIPAGIATLNPLLALSGLFKGPAYMVSWAVGEKTEGGELLTGAVLWGALFIHV